MCLAVLLYCYCHFFCIDSVEPDPWPLSSIGRESTELLSARSPCRATSMASEKCTFCAKAILKIGNDVIGHSGCTAHLCPSALAPNI